MGNKKSKTKVIGTYLTFNNIIYDRMRYIVFKFNGKSYNISCFNDEYFSSIIKKLKNRIGLKDQNLFFMSDGHKLNSEMKLNQIKSNVVEVYEENNVIGGLYPINFADISKQVHEEHYFSDTAPSYRTATQGINIYGICKGKYCKANKNEVIVPQIEKKKFDLIKEINNLQCPECGGVIIPKTLGFHLCKYKVSGKKFINEKSEPFEFEGRADNEESIQYFNPDTNGETMVIELKIEVEYL